MCETKVLILFINIYVLLFARWKITRSQLMPAFTVAKLKPLFPLIEEVCHELKEYIDKNRHTGTVAETRDTQVLVLRDQTHRYCC
jgi:cytochrome P450